MFLLFPIIGAGKDKTKFDVTNNVIVFQTVNESSTPGTPADDSSSTTLNQARQIVMKDFTVATTQTTQPVFKLQSCKMSNFENIRISGPWTTGTPITRANAGIELGSLSSVVCTQENKFDHITVDGMSVGIVVTMMCNNRLIVVILKIRHGIQFDKIVLFQGQYVPKIKLILNLKTLIEKD